MHPIAQLRVPGYRREDWDLPRRGLVGSSCWNTARPAGGSPWRHWPLSPVHAPRWSGSNLPRAAGRLGSPAADRKRGSGL